MTKSSDISGFYRADRKKRLEIVREFAALTDDEIDIINKGKVDQGILERMIENVIGEFSLPLGIAVNFLIDGKDYMIPMAIEETSVVAACSYAAKIARVKGGFKTTATPPVMIGQVQICKIPNIDDACSSIQQHKDELISKANENDPLLVKLGGGAKDIEIRKINTSVGDMIILHLLVDVRDAMGANTVNTMCESIAPYVEKITGGKVYLRIISNLAKYRLARAEAVFSKDIIGEDVVDGIINAYAFAESDPYRCATHNKGIMNGIDAVLIATGNDFRAVEAAAHSYASLNGKYSSLTKYRKNENGDIVGEIELPLPVGLIGGATKVHPVAKTNIKILGVKNATELSRVIASVGLAQNFAALRALTKEGIQKGHMSLHARNIAIMAGAKGEDIDRIAEQLIKEKKIRIDRAKELLET